ncbi:MAG: phosphotransferase, partial [Chloroflexota bacterium]|nr:phosphotransferase [Chloroflexota bacterium]
LRAPRLLGIDHTPPGPGTWLWTEDVAPALAVRWTPDRALAAARSAGRLHALFVAEREDLERQGWLERDGYAAYAHHVPAAHRHLEQLPTHPHWTHLFADEERAALHRALDLTPRAITELRRLPPTLIHGDFHVDNLGCDPDGTVVAIDWAHVGIAPLGSDVAVLTSLYTALGGTGASHRELESAAIEVYFDQLAAPGARPDTQLHAVVRRACGLWNLTWGLHLRLGPGLDWLLRRPDPASADATRSAADVRHGCLRVVTFLAGV